MLWCSDVLTCLTFSILTDRSTRFLVIGRCNLDSSLFLP